MAVRLGWKLENHSVSIESGITEPLNREPRITIITASFNAATLIQRCIESVKAQDCPGVDHVVIDGGSNDGTLDVLRRNANTLAAWISEPDQGIYDAWNKGLAIARGEWIGFLGADDVLLPGALSLYAESIRANAGAEYISSKVRHVYGDGRSRIIGETWSWPRFQRLMTVAHPGSLHRKSIFQRLGLYDTSYRITGDYELLLRAGSTLNAVFLPQVTVQMGGGGVSDSRAALDEASRAKRTTGGRSAFANTVDATIARAKLYLRSTQKP